MKQCMRVSVLAVALGGLGLAQGVMACTGRNGNDSYSDSFTVANNVSPNVVLINWRGNTSTAPSFTGCPRLATFQARFTPGMAGLTFVRNVTVDGQSYPAFGWSSTSPLVVFRHYQAASGPGAAYTPVDPRRAVDFTGRSGGSSSISNNTMAAALQVAIVSRGGPMTSVSRASYSGNTQLTTYPGAGVISHSVTFDVNVPALACTLSDASLVLADVRATDLPANGRTSGDRTLAVTMNCPSAGTPVKLTMTDATGNTGAAGQLAPIAGSTAGGVRIRILRGTTPVAFGAQWDHGSSGAGNQSINFTAQYIRTGNITAGSIGGRATLLADYR